MYSHQCSDCLPVHAIALVQGGCYNLKLCAKDIMALELKLTACVTDKLNPAIPGFSFSAMGALETEEARNFI